MDKEILLNDVLSIIEDHLGNHLPDFVLVAVASDIVDLFETLGSDIHKLEDADGVTSWLLKEVLDNKEGYYIPDTEPFN